TPPGAPIHSSWSGADANFGELSSGAFASPASACIVLPVLHGPSVEGLAVSLLDADTGSVITTIPLRNIDMNWQFWRIYINPASKALKIVARDQGTGWGQWLAVSDPLA